MAHHMPHQPNGADYDAVNKRQDSHCLVVTDLFGVCFPEIPGYAWCSAPGRAVLSLACRVHASTFQDRSYLRLKVPFREWNLACLFSTLTPCIW